MTQSIRKCKVRSFLLDGHHESTRACRRFLFYLRAGRVAPGRPTAVDTPATRCHNGLLRDFLYYTCLSGAVLGALYGFVYGFVLASLGSFFGAEPSFWECLPGAGVGLGIGAVAGAILGLAIGACLLALLITLGSIPVLVWLCWHKTACLLAKGRKPS
jgi:hypothetical protein